MCSVTRAFFLAAQFLFLSACLTVQSSCNMPFARVATDTRLGCPSRVADRKGSILPFTLRLSQGAESVFYQPRGVTRVKGERLQKRAESRAPIICRVFKKFENHLLPPKHNTTLQILNTECLTRLLPVHVLKKAKMGTLFARNVAV